MKRNLLFSLLLIIVIAVSYVSFAEMINGEKFVIVNSEGKRMTFLFEIANTPEKQRVGLSNRDDLNEGEGMVFPTRDEKVYSMWMKDTRIPLDMLFVARDGEIKHIHPMAEPYSEKTISYEQQVSAVIELRGGVASKKNIKEGDKVIHPMFLNAKN